MRLGPEVVENVLTELLGRLPTGRSAAIRGGDLAGELGISERTLRGLVDELIDRGWLVGSTCSGERPGYFLCRDFADVEAGCAHLVSRARALGVRVARMRAAAEATFGDHVATLFDLEDLSSV